MNTTGPQNGDAIIRRTVEGFITVLKSDVDLRSDPMPYADAENTARASATGRIWVDIDGYPVVITL